MDSVQYRDLSFLGYPGYRVGSDGSVWSRWKRLKTTPGSHGYPRVWLIPPEGKAHKKMFHVHTLVLSAFIGARPDGMQCRHIDGTRTNNHLENLRWGTQSENERDKISHGTISTVLRKVGEDHLRAKLTEAIVLEIRRRREEGESLNSLAARFHVGCNNIQKIVYRKTWKHI